MAEKEKELSMENVEEVIKSGAVVTEEIAKEAAQKIADKRKEELTERLIGCMKRSDYSRKKIFLSMKKTDKLSKIKLNYLKKFSALDEDLKAGKVSVDEYDNKCKELKKEAIKLISENDHWFDEQSNALDHQYPESYGWRYQENVI